MPALFLKKGRHVIDLDVEEVEENWERLGEKTYNTNIEKSIFNKRKNKNKAKFMEMHKYFAN